MGEVYFARDGKLDREVAIEVFPEVMTHYPERVARFEREAKVLASLNHPNIASVYGLDESNGTRFLVLEYVEGETPGSHLRRGPVAGNYTRPDVVLGTPAYMSPEQARGTPLDKRTDIWSFGVVLFECFSGRRPFEGDTTSDVVARILEREPDWTLLPAATPPLIQLLLRRCLAKDPRPQPRRHKLGVRVG